MTPVLQLENVTKRFGSLDVLKGITLSLNQGESATILGPSGSGKSTLLHIAGLMEKPTAGTVALRGQSTSNMSDKDRAFERLQTVGFVFQFHYLLPDFNVLENVLMPAQLAGDDLEQAAENARRVLGRLGLSERLTHRPHELSGGEQQRTAFARAIIRKPKLLLCDEPTGNLDQETAQRVMDLIWSEVKSENMAAIVVTHNPALSSQSDHAYQLVAGRFV